MIPHAKNHAVSLVRWAGGGGGVAIAELGMRIADWPRPAGSVMTIAFELQGQHFVALNGGPGFPFTNAVSLVVNCESQTRAEAAEQRSRAARLRQMCAAEIEQRILGQ